MRESLKPIEPGCLAIIVDTVAHGCRPNGIGRQTYPAALAVIGQVVEVLGPPSNGCPHCVTVSMTPRGDPSDPRPAATLKTNLIRIDPDDEQREAWELDRQAGPDLEQAVDVLMGTAGPLLARRLRELD